MRVICAWCKAVIEEGPPPVSHGICPSCEARQMDQVKFTPVRGRVDWQCRVNQLLNGGGPLTEEEQEFADGVYLDDGTPEEFMGGLKIFRGIGKSL